MYDGALCEVARTVRNIALGAFPWVPGQRRYGVTGFDADELSEAIGGDVPGARIARLEVVPAGRMTTDHAHVSLTWNAAGQAAGLPARVFVKGTPGQVSTRVLNSAFGLCQNEVRFYNELHHAVADVTLEPYLARLRSGGRFAIALGTLDPSEASFVELGDTVPREQAEATVDALATLHAPYWNTPRFDDDLAWLVPYSRQPGWPVGQRVMPLLNRTWLQRQHDVPQAVKELTTYFLAHRGVVDDRLESLPHTFCHGDTHAANTFARADGSAGLFDWQQVHRAPGMRDVSYFIGWSLDPEVRRAAEKELIERYLARLSERGVVEVPSLAQAFEQHRWMTAIAWNAAWAPLAMYGGDDETLRERLISRFATALQDLDTADALRTLVGK